jgi:hypothetical protein
MSVPKNKLSIIDLLETERKRLVQNLSHLSCEDMLQAGVVGEWSIKDILAHLADWEAHMPVWLDKARHGESVITPEEDLTWKQLDLFNQRVYEAHRHQSLEHVLAYFHSIHNQFMLMVTEMPEDEMLTPGRYAFIGKGAVVDWLSAYAGHDRWAKTAIRKWIKAQNR